MENQDTNFSHEPKDKIIIFFSYFCDFPSKVHILLS